MALKKEVKKSEFIHSSLMDTNGTIIQFLNSQAMHGLGVAEVFGGIRIAVNDPRKIPGYLSKYKGIIRNHADFNWKPISKWRIMWLDLGKS